MIEVKIETLMGMLEEREEVLNKMLVQFNLQMGQVQGEISMINQMLELAKKEALPSEDETEA